MNNHELTSSELYNECKLEDLTFETTSELEPLEDVIGQPRAIEAVRFGVDIPQAGYHIFAAGPEGTGTREMILDLLKQRASSRPAADLESNDFEPGEGAARIPRPKSPHRSHSR